MSKLSLREAADLISAVGHLRTVYLQGSPGIGKTSILNILAERHPTYLPVYIDCTTKMDAGDFLIPQPINGEMVWSPNSELQMFTGKPAIYMIDEHSKANKPVQLACTTAMQERRWGVHPFHPGSMIFATGNLPSDGLGDTLMPHSSNRVIKVQVRSPNEEEWLQDFALPNNLNLAVCAAARETPSWFASYEAYDDPALNYDIYDPREKRAAFVTPRSLHAASDILNHSQHLPEHVWHLALAGTVGQQAADTIRAVVRLDAELPTWDEIVTTPLYAKVPKNGAAASMTVFRIVSRVERETLDSVMAYVNRLSKESQALFAYTIMAPASPKKGFASTNARFITWLRENDWLLL